MKHTVIIENDKVSIAKYEHILVYITVRVWDI